MRATRKFSLRSLFGFVFIASLLAYAILFTSLALKRRASHVDSLESLIAQALDVKTEKARFETGSVKVGRGRSRLPEWALAALGGRECHPVTSIKLIQVELGKEDLIRIASFAGLQSLAIDSCKTPSGDLANLRFPNNLRHLCIGQAGLPDEDLCRILSNNRLTRLSELELWHNPITDRGLWQLRHLKRLSRLNVCGTDVTQSGVDRLRTVIPNCKIFWDGEESMRVLIKDPSAFEFHTTDPLNLVEKVNHLHSIGRDRAIQSLREYVRFATLRQQQRLFLILPWVFPVSFPSAASSRLATPAKWSLFDHVGLSPSIPLHSNIYYVSELCCPHRLDDVLEWVDSTRGFRASPIKLPPDPRRYFEGIKHNASRVFGMSGPSFDLQLQLLEEK